MKKLLLLVIFLAFFLRFFKLGEVPTGLSNDEAGYIYSAYSIWKTGHDISGAFLPISINLDNSFSPVYIYAIAPFVGIFDLAPFWGRFPFAVLGAFSVLLFYLLTKRVTNEKIALFSTFVFAVSPWHLHISRAALDAVFALFFYLLSIFIMYKNEKKGSILWALPFLFLAFYSYHGTKLFYIFFIPFLLFLLKVNLLKRKKELILFVLGFFLIILSFIYVSKTQNVTRQKVFFWSDSVTASEVVNKERDRNTAPFVIRSVMNNKPLYYLRLFRENYLEAFSPQFLFLHGEPGGMAPQFGTLYRGAMYLIELPLLILGLYYLASKKKRAFLFVLGGLLIAPLSSAFTIDRSYINRSVMMLPFLMIGVGSGIYFGFDLIKSKKEVIKKILIIGFVGLYTCYVISYLYQYYFRYPVYASEAWYYSSRELSQILHDNKDKYKTLMITPGSEMFFFQYAIYNQVEPYIMQKFWADPENMKVDNILLERECLVSKVGGDPNIFLEKSSLYIVPYDCYDKAVPAILIKDRGEKLQTRWKVYTKE